MGNTVDQKSDNTALTLNIDDIPTPSTWTEIGKTEDQYPHQTLLQACKKRDTTTALYRGLPQRLQEAEDTVLDKYPAARARVDQWCNLALYQYRFNNHVETAERLRAIASLPDPIRSEVRSTTRAVMAAERQKLLYSSQETLKKTDT